MLRTLPAFWENVEDADWLYLNDTEAVRWTGRPSLVTIMLSVIGGLIMVITGIVITRWLLPVAADAGIPGWVGYLPVLLTIVGIGWVVLAYLRWVRVLYVITDEEVYVKHGLISRDITQIRLGRVQNTAFDQSVLERFLRFGDVRIYTAGTATDDLLLRSVPNPQRISQLLTELLSDRANATSDRPSP